MPKIRQLSHLVITKIAAGEVIERPASVVKELLENALDAGAKRIEVEIEQGGIERILVIDDGHGMEPDDLPLAFASHATSKLRDAEDLFRVATLGFRGEALASIGGVAQVRLQSRAAGHDIGAEISCHGSEVTPVTHWNGSPGTRIDVKHLFFNTPVRRKFLRGPSTELGHVSEIITRLALSHPGVGFSLKHNNRTVFDVPGSSSLADRIRLFFGSAVADALYLVNASQTSSRLNGYVADPSVERGNARMQYLFLNGRWIRDRSLGHAVQEAYRGLIMTGRYPISFLFLEMAPDAVDVNVHPTKCEVRFRDGSAHYHLLMAAIRERLRQANLVPRLMPPPEGLKPTADPWSDPLAQYTAPPPPPQMSSPSTLNNGPREAISNVPRDIHTAIQLHDAYLVVETPDGMLVIDQHALHERILFEQLLRRIRGGELERQRLLIPEPLDLPPDQAGRVMECKTDLAELGLEIEDFGGGTIVLHAFPALLGRCSPGTILKDVTDLLISKDRAPNRDQLFNDVLASMACRAAVKAGDRLSPEEISELLAQRDLAENTHHCPHGRPTSLLFSRQELDRQFRRI